MDRHYFDESRIRFLWEERKDPNECQVHDCQESKEEYKDYCLNHNWECSAKSCSNRIRYETFGSIYCSQHKYSCQKDGCQQRVSSSYEYCREHEQKYFCQECRVRIGRGESYCSQHQNWKYCPVRNKVYYWDKKYAVIKDWASYDNGYSSYPRYDEEENCQRKAFNGEVYCSKHKNECLEYSCQRRLDGRNKYCYEHAPLCPTICQSGSACTSKVTTGEVYCSSHSKVCLTCSYRISDYQTYCYDHEKSCSDCSTRIAYNKYVCQSCGNQKSEQERLKSLVKQKTSLSNPQEVVKFDVWFNPNCATCVNYDGYYRVFLIICEPSHKGMPEIPPQVFPRNRSTSQWGTEMRRDNHNYLSDAQSEAQRLREKLRSCPNPILVVFSSLTLRFDENYSFEKAGVKKYDLPSDALNNPDQYIRPLDVVSRRIGNSNMYHFAIYLGNRKVVHIYNSSSFSNSSGNKWSRSDSWTEFLRRNPSGGKIIRYHPIIPFKHKNAVINHIAKAVVEKYKEGKYSAFEENCEHFVNEIVLGIGFSQQAEVHRKVIGTIAESLLMSDPRDPFPFTPDPSHFTEEINLKGKINETNEKLNNLAKYKTSEVEEKIREIKNYDESRWISLIEIPSKDCKIM